MRAGVTIKGMTGLGHATAERDGVRVEVELKGVNHRYLDPKLRLPPELASQEAALRGRIQKVIARGRVDIAVSLESSRPPVYRVEANRALVAEYLKAAAAFKAEFRLKGTIGIETIAALPGAIAVRAEAGASDGLAAALLTEAFEDALQAFDAMRSGEGLRLVGDLLAHFEAIEEAVRSIEREARGLPEAYAARLRERVAALISQRGLDDVRLAQEVALMADRADVTEELVRLGGYLAQAREMLQHPTGPVGKTLDFVMQEMNREANTISSKAESLPICQEALRIKSEVEKIREQVQNLE
jgi:uncharacterized protein (TIGR00255 family)